MVIDGSGDKSWLLKKYQPQAPAPVVKDAKDILTEAINCLEKRGEKYNKDNNREGRERHMGEILVLFNQLTGHKLTTRDGWVLMICLKLVRAYANGGNDCWVDGAAYMALAGEIDNG